MQFTNSIIAAFAIVNSVALADNCAAGSTDVDGNWYCQPVKGIKYSNVGSPGSYNKVTSMGSNGDCASVPTSFSGPIAPLDEEVSLHFRGPLKLKQFGAYTLSASSKKRKAASERVLRHGHQYYHKRNAEKREATATEAEEGAKASADTTLDERDMVVAVINGKTVSWENNYFGPAAATVAPVVAAKVLTTPIAVADAAKVSVAPAVASSKAKTSAKVAACTPGTAAYNRVGYYDSASQHSDGLTFLGNHGGAGSGVFDYTYGMSLSYLNAAGTGGATSSTILSDTTIPSDSEFTIMTNQACSGDSCGFYRQGSVAYHGFAGADKVFVMEFEMPLDGNTGFNGDMPAIWMLNAQIPRTVQYGSPSCSCWTTGCGEFDIVETLSPGSTFMKSTFHTNVAAGCSDYILRPTTSTMKLAVVFSSATSTVQIQVLPDTATFPASLTKAQLASWMASTPGTAMSLFTLS